MLLLRLATVSVLVNCTSKLQHHLPSRHPGQVVREVIPDRKGRAGQLNRDPVGVDSLGKP